MTVDNTFIEVSEIIALDILEGSPHGVSMLAFGIERFIRDAVEQGATLDSLNVQLFQTLEDGVKYLQINVTGRRPDEA